MQAITCNMLKGHDFIYFGPEKWEGLWRNRHHLMSRFSELNKVLYVEPKITLKNLRNQLREGELARFWQDLKQNRLTKVGEKLHIYHNPAFIPISGRFPLDKITLFLWVMSLKLTLRKLRFERPIIWLSRPDMVDLVGRFNEKLLIYHVVDEYLSYSGLSEEQRHWLENIEKRMLNRADLVIVVSEKLYQAKRPFNKRTYLVPNGVDYQAYSAAIDSDEQVPIDIAHLPWPVIGYSGLISERLDLKLLYHLASVQPEWSIVLMGEIDARHCAQEIDKLRQIKNIYFWGRKEIGQVPSYVKAFDVCIIPYEMNKLAENVSSLKLYDSLATGKPIVTTDFPAAHQFKDVVRIADTKENFVHYVQESLTENDSDLLEKRRWIASQNTWEDRVKQISELIQSRLKASNG